MTRYRQYLTDVGEPLFRVGDPLDMLERSHQLSLDLGVGRSETWLSTPVCIPVPLHDPERGLAQPGMVQSAVHRPGFPTRWPDGRPVPRWPRANPEFVWNPLFWLPDHLCAPIEVVHADGAVTQEDMTSWALRVVLDLHAVGLYDNVKGWLDVLEPVGIDTETLEGRMRVEAWLRGGRDHVLDHFSIDSYFSQAAGWSLQESYDFASRMAPVMVRANLALAADRILEYVDDVDEDDWSLFVSEMDALSPLWLPGWGAGLDGDRGPERLRVVAAEQFSDHVAMLELLDDVSDQVVTAFETDPEPQRSAGGVGGEPMLVGAGSPVSPASAPDFAAPPPSLQPPPLGPGWD